MPAASLCACWRSALLLLACATCNCLRASSAQEHYETTGQQQPATREGWERTGVLRHPRSAPSAGQPASSTALPSLRMELQWCSDSIARVRVRDTAGAGGSSARWAPERALPDFVGLPCNAAPAQPRLEVEPTNGLESGFGFTVLRPCAGGASCQEGQGQELFRMHDLFFSDQYISCAWLTCPCSPQLRHSLFNGGL